MGRICRGAKLALDLMSHGKHCITLKSTRLNCGSSSLKFGLLQVVASILKRFSRARSSRSAAQGKVLGERRKQQALVSESTNFASQQDAVARIVAFLADYKESQPMAIGHRVVHSGQHLRRHCLVDGMVLRQLEEAASFAPLHNPLALSVIRFAQEHFPQLPQVACFDTAFHAGLPNVAHHPAIPQELRSHGIRRYGFHRLSCESIIRQLGTTYRPDRLIIAHLGNGRQHHRVKDGQSIDTSMGLTPAGGVIMGNALRRSRSGCAGLFGSREELRRRASRIVG